MLSNISNSNLKASTTNIIYTGRATTKIDLVIKAGFFSASLVAVLITFVIIFSICFESYKFFSYVSPFDFLFGLHWSPQGDHPDLLKDFGVIPLFTGTLLITTIAIALAVPFGLMSAIYIAEYMNENLRAIIKPLLEILAGIPTIIYGYFAALTMAPFIKIIGQYFNLNVASESALSAGIAMGIMIIPFILSISEDILNSVPRNLREASLAMGATKTETIVKAILPAALPGIMGAVLLAISRAIGETMIVVMAAGLRANLTLNPLDSVTTITAQIVSLLVGDQEFNSPKTLAAFALSLSLFLVTLIINIVALLIIKKYKEQYD